MPKVRINTTIELNLYELAREKNIKWSEALRFGLIQLTNNDFFFDEHDKVIDGAEAELMKVKLLKLTKANTKLQGMILELGKKLKEAGIDVVEKKE